MRHKTAPEKAKDAAAATLVKTRQAVDQAAHSDAAARAVEVARTAETRLATKAQEAAVAVGEVNGRRRRRAAQAHADAALAEAATARQQLEAALVEQTRHAAEAAQKAFEKTEASPVGWRARRATKVALKEAKAAAKTQRKARGSHRIRNGFLVVTTGGAAALAASEDLRAKVMEALGMTSQDGSAPPMAPG